LALEKALNNSQSKVECIIFLVLPEIEKLMKKIRKRKQIAREHMIALAKDMSM